MNFVAVIVFVIGINMYCSSTLAFLFFLFVYILKTHTSATEECRGKNEITRFKTTDKKHIKTEGYYSFLITLFQLLFLVTHLTKESSFD